MGLFSVGSTIPRRLHGDYVGINPTAVSRGATFIDSKTRFRVDKSGVYVQVKIGGRNFDVFHAYKKWVIDVRQSPVIKRWVSQSFPPRRFAILQDPSSELAASIFDFSPFEVAGVRCQAMMFLGEGMPMPLGAYIMSSQYSGTEIERSLAELYQFFRADVQPDSGAFNYLQELDVEQAKQIMTDQNPGTISQRIDIVKKAGNNLWTGTEAQISARLALLALGLKDVSGEVQEETLRQFVLSARVTGAVALVTDYLKQAISAKNRSIAVLKGAVYAAVCLLSEAYGYRLNCAPSTGELSS